VSRSEHGYCAETPRWVGGHTSCPAVRLQIDERTGRAVRGHSVRHQSHFNIVEKAS